MIPALLSPNDVIVRAHTGTGKSFSVLLALLAKPRLVFRSSSGTSSPGVTGLIMVPSNELAWQYMRWAHELIPTTLHGSLDMVLQCVVRGTADADQQIARLRAHPPHCIVGTPTRIKELLELRGGSHLLGVPTLRTLVLDEADALLQLPGRFPTEKQRWKHMAHRSAGLEVLNTIMKSRATYSGGERIMTAGLEREASTHRTERRPPETIRRTQYRGAERTELAPPVPRGPSTTPLQLVCTSATANSVLRHFFGARTGWLRTNTRETRQLAKWIDLTGMSGRLSEVPALLIGAIPREIQHSCVVADEVQGAPELRLLDVQRAKDSREAAPASRRPEHEVDTMLLETLAYMYATQATRRGLALLPPRWSMRRVEEELQALGVPVRVIRAEEEHGRAEDVLYLLQSTSARGLDVPDLSQVYLVGLSSVIDAVHYTHAAGRVARLGVSAPTARPDGHVVTLLRRDPAAEAKMARIYGRLHVSLVPVRLRADSR